MIVASQLLIRPVSGTYSDQIEQQQLHAWFSEYSKKPSGLVLLPFQ